ncbi:MAG: hypothetical protein AB7I27_11795 [Bacteriovoracaceae bacterium]
MQIGPKKILPPLLFLGLGIYLLLALFQNMTPNAIYVSPINGSNDNSGTIDAPLKTIEAGLKKISNNETLILREGIYLISTLKINKSNITIKAFPRERVILKNAIPISNWQSEQISTLNGQNITFYKTTIPEDVCPKAENCQVSTASVLDKLQIKILNRYKDKNDFLSSEHSLISTNVYVGPGFFQEGRTVYLRLDQVNDKAAFGETKLPATFFAPFGKTDNQLNPNNYKIEMSFKNIGIQIGNENLVSDLNLEGIEFHQFLNAIRIYNSNNITFRNLKMIANIDSFLIQVGKSNNNNFYSNSNLKFLKIYFNAKFPKYLAWSDVKQMPQRAGYLKSSGIQVTSSENEIPEAFNVHHVLVKNCVFENLFDGIATLASVNDWVVSDNFFAVQDDSWQLGYDSYNIHFKYNLVFGPGISTHGTKLSIAAKNNMGSKYIHHNIIDTARLDLIGCRKPLSNGCSSIMMGHMPFPHHGGNSNDETEENIQNESYDMRKIYNNTVIFENTPGSGQNGKGESSLAQNLVMNNIFIQKNQNGFLFRSLKENNDLFESNWYYHPQTNKKQSIFQVDGTLTSILNEKNSQLKPMTLDLNYFPLNENLQQGSQLGADFPESEDSIGAVNSKNYETWSKRLKSRNKKYYGPSYSTMSLSFK